MIVRVPFLGGGLRLGADSWTPDLATTTDLGNKRCAFLGERRRERELTSWQARFQVCALEQGLAEVVLGVGEVLGQRSVELDE